LKYAISVRNLVTLASAILQMMTEAPKFKTGHLLWSTYVSN